MCRLLHKVGKASRTFPLYRREDEPYQEDFVTASFRALSFLFDDPETESGWQPPTLTTDIVQSSETKLFQDDIKG